MVIDWRPAPERPRLPDGEVHLWRVDQSAAAGPVADRVALLSPAERERMERYRFERDRRRFALRRGALRRILAVYLGTDPARIALRLSPRGKPELVDAGGPPLRFNVSHSGELALVGVTRGPDLGVDVEIVRPLDDLDGLVREVFSPAERREFAALPPGDRAAGFFNGWTRKEAFLKAQGEGLFGDLAGFDVPLAPGREPRLLRVRGAPGEAGRWILLAPVPAPGAVAALAVRSTSCRLAAWAAA